MTDMAVLRDNLLPHPTRLLRNADLATAANEIERLQLMLAGSESLKRGYIAEVERLRAVLESLTKDPPASLAREPDEDWEVIVKMRAIARGALEGAAPDKPAEDHPVAGWPA